MGLAAISEQKYNDEDLSSSGTFLLLSRFGAFVSTAVASIREDGKDSDREYR